MTEETTLAQVRDIMLAFADETGVSSNRQPVRYLWTDAFAVCTYLTLYQETGDETHLDLARQLVDQVHHVLGQHRDDDHRVGWISGLDPEAGERHPTAGGLRIGKPMNERDPGEAYDPRREWDRDGQYYHYLTKWMHALRQVGVITGESRYLRWAVELARVAHAAFTVRDPDGRQRMVWKMSIDLSRPLVPSMGQHDPLDGLVTYLSLDAVYAGDLDLAKEIAQMRQITEGLRLTTDDPLGVGGLLADAYRVAQLGDVTTLLPAGLLPSILRAADRGLDTWLRTRPLGRPAGARLAFRELGLAIGLRAVGRIDPEAANGESLAALQQRGGLAEQIASFWLDPGHQRANTWLEHENINRVMLATYLAPEGYLRLAAS